MSSGYIALGLGGLSNPMTTAGDMIYGGAAGLATRLGIGSVGQVLSVSAGGIPEWATVGGTGTVTSVGMTVPTFLSVAGSPVTTTGTLAVTLATQVMNTIFAGPGSGADAAPTFRALVAADIPSLPASKITSGTLAVAQGGTNLASGTSGGILGYTAAGVLASSVALTASALVLGGGAGATPTPMASLGTTTTVLHGNAAGAPTFGAVSLTADVSGTLPVANGGLGITTGTSGGILGFTASGTLASSVALTASALVLGGGAGATPTPMGSLGTTTTVLHGNAAGAPTFGAVSLTADVSGTLPVANGGTNNTTFTAYAVLCAGTTATGAFQNVSGVGTSGQVLTSNGAAALPTWQAAGGGITNSTVHLTGVSGRGSTGSCVIGIWTNNSTTGSSLTYATSATNGDTITVNTTGLYAISCSFAYSNNGTSGARWGLSLNQADVTTFIGSLADANLAAPMSACCIQANPTVIAITRWFTASDVIRLNISTAYTTENNTNSYFTMTRVA